MHLLSVFSLRNRALIALVTVVIALFGGIALTSLRQELIPSVTFPQLVIVTPYPGAAPAVVESDVSTPIESAIQVVSGIQDTSASSSTDFSTVTASFDYGTNLAAAELNVTLAIDRIQSQLPDVQSQVIAGSLDDLPVVQIAVTSDLDATTLSTRLNDATLTDIQQLDGVRTADLLGTTAQRVTITPDSDALATAGQTTQDIRDALDANGDLLPSGSITENGQTLTVQSGTRLSSVDEIAALPLVGATSSDGGVVSIADVATVTLANDPVTGISRVNGESALTIAVTKTPDANTVRVSHEVRDLIPSLESALGDGTRMTVVFDQAPFIEQSIESLASEGGLGLIFAVIVILVFLLSIRSTLVTAISIPASVLITFIGMLAFGYSLNILTLGALTISIGRVVDDSIVVIENIKRHLSLGQEKTAAILSAVREVAGAITASTITTVAVFLPLALVGDITGELFRPFALTVTIALAASLFVALTIVPVLAYWFLRSPKPAAVAASSASTSDAMTSSPDRAEVREAADLRGLEAETSQKRLLPAALAPAPDPATRLPDPPAPAASAPIRRHRHADDAFVEEHETPTRLQRAYLPVVRFTLRRRWATLVAAVLLLAGTGALVPSLQTNFIGDSGQNTLTVAQSLPVGTSLDEQDAAASRVEDALLDVPGVAIVQLSLGQSGNSIRQFFGSGDITYSITTDPDADQAALQDDVRAAIADLADVGEVTLQAGGSGFASSDIEVDLTASGPDALAAASDSVLDAVQDLPTVAQATSNLAESQPYLAVTVDRDLAAEAGLTELQVGGIVAEAKLPAAVGAVTIDDDTLSIYIDNPLAPVTVQELRDFQIPSARGQIPLTDVATVEQLDGPASITTIRGLRSATVSVTPEGTDVGAASIAVQNAVDGIDLPAGTSAELGGVTSQQNDAFSQLLIAFLVSILIVYVVMVATFKSLRQPLELLVSIPFAATGAILLQLISGIPLGVPSIIGIIMLVGIVVTNAIVLVDLINQYRARGLSAYDAVVQGASRRLRPILMTAAATIFALVPLAAGLTGSGGFISQPLAIIVIGGLVSSTLLTLVVLPALYYLVEGAAERRVERRTRRAIGAETAAAASDPAV